MDCRGKCMSRKNSLSSRKNIPALTVFHASPAVTTAAVYAAKTVIQGSRRKKDAENVLNLISEKGTSTLKVMMILYIG